MAEPDRTEQEIFARWDAEIKFAQKDKKYVTWTDQGDKILKRYRDERKTPEIRLRKFNVLWSNVETLSPAVYSKMPKPIVERRYLDRDPVARLASTILERTLSFQQEAGYFHAATQKAVKDYLLPGMGQIWARYEPQFDVEEAEAENAKVESEEKTADQIEEDGDGEPYQKVAYERVCADYVYWRDFLWGPARCWQEVPWVARRSWLTKSQVEDRFGEDKAKKIVLDYVPDRNGNDAVKDDSTIGYFKKAEIWEIWNKADRMVYFIAPATAGMVLDKTKPEFDLEGFWPCPEPLFTTQTNDTLIPVPDFVEYQDQAQELDDLTQRIAMITTAVKAAGVYDASFPALARLLQDGADNKLIPVDQWAAFAEKGGMKGAVDLLPMNEIIEVLFRLIEARAQVKTDLYEITGMGDIVRGQGNPNETATAQRIKGQFASLRLQDRQDDVSRFTRDALHIIAEIVAEVFTPESLSMMSGYDQTVQDEIRKAVAKVPPPQPPEPPPAPPEGSPPPPPEVQQQMAMQAQAAQQQAMQQFQQAQQQASQQAQQQAMGEFQQALEILRSDKLRSFRIDIETDSTIQADAQADKESAIELFSSTLQGLEAAGPVIMQAPELLKPLGDILLNAFRKFRVGRSMEAGLEESLTKLEERMEEQKGQPPPPTPEQIKAQSEQQRMEQQMQMDQQTQQAESQRATETHQFEMQRMQAEFATEKQRSAMEMEMERERNAMEMDKMRQELEFEREKLGLKREELALNERSIIVKSQLEAQSLENKAEANREDHELNRESAQQSHQLGLETMEAKAKAAKTAAAKPTGASK